MKTVPMQCCKYTMFFSNFLIFIAGGLLVGFGIWGLADGKEFSKLFTDIPVVTDSVIVLIVIGSVVVISGFLGCTGAIRESRCLLGLFFTIMLLLFIAEFVMITLLFVYFPRAKETAESNLIYSNSTKVVWDSLQSALKCCGFENPQDWAEEPEFPPTCCADPAECSLSSASLHTVGCETAIRDYFWLVGGIAIGVLAFELLSMIFACCLFQGIDTYEAA